MTHSAGKTIARNTAAILSGTIVLKALNFVFRIFLVRSLGDELFGEYSIVFAFVGLFQVIAEPGITQYVMREIARDRMTAEQYFWNLIAVRLILGAFSTVLITAAAYVVGYSPTIVVSIFLLTLSFLLAAFDAPMQTVIIANERYDHITMLNIVGQVAYMLLGTFVLISGQGIVLLFAVGLLAMVPQMFLAARIIRRNGYLKTKPSISPRIWKPLVIAGLPFGITTLTLVIAQSIDTVMLSWFRSSEEIGWYNAAYRLAVSTLFLFEGFSRALVPSLARAFVTDKEYVDNWYYRSARAIAITGVPIAVGGMILAEPLVQLLLGSQFAPAAPILQILIWDVPFIMFAGFCGSITTVVNKERLAARINAVNALANIGLNLLFIPRYGIVAAAIISVITDVLSAGQFHFSLSREMKLPNLIQLLARVAIAAVTMGVLVYVLNGMPVTVRIGVGIISYAMMLVVLRVLNQSDWNLISNLLRRGWGKFRHAEVAQ